MPVSQAVENQFLRLRVIGIERIAAASVIDVAAWIVELGAVIGEVIDAAKTKSRSSRVALGRVVVDDVEDDLDAGIMNGSDHLAEFFDRLVTSITGCRSKEGNRVITPEVAKAALCEMKFVDEGMHRHQLERCDAERIEIIENLAMTHTAKGAALGFAERRMTHREAAHIHLVKHCLGPRNAGSGAQRRGTRANDSVGDKRSAIE